MHNDDEMEYSPRLLVRYRRQLLGAGLAVVLGAGGLWGWLAIRDAAHYAPFGSKVVNATGFRLYYPSPMPVGCKYAAGSQKSNQGLFVYELGCAGGRVTIIEQTAPSNMPDLNHLAGFTTFQTLAGNVAIGQALSSPVAILATDSTLVNITGHDSLPKDVIGNIARALTSYPLQ